MAQFPINPKADTGNAGNPELLAWSQSDVENRFGFKGGRHTGVNHVFAFIIAVLLTAIGYALKGDRVAAAEAASRARQLAPGMALPAELEQFIAQPQ